MIYQEALIHPGILPCKASSRNEILESPNLRIVARGLPVSVQRLTKRTGEEFLGNLVKLCLSDVKIFL